MEDQQQLSTSDVTVQQQQQQQQDGSLFVSPFKGPKIAWKKQFKRINTVTAAEATTVDHVQQQQNDSSSSHLGSNSVNSTCDSSIHVSEGSLDKSTVALMTEKTAEDTCNKENVITKVAVPSTPTKKSSKRKVISPCTILANNTEEQTQPDTNLASRKTGFNCEEQAQEIKLEDTKFTSSREQKLAKRIVLNRVNTINHNSSSSKVALRFVF